MSASSFASCVFSGVQPSGGLTLGNYLGAIRNWIAFQKEHPCFFCIVDCHAITVPQDPRALRRATLEVAATYIAAGIDPKKSTLFVQSQVPGHSELAWILGCFTPLGWLNRMTQFKDKAGKNRESASLGLYGYPVLMAADVLLYKATHVPVGEDQKQHLELARDIAGAFNRHFDVSCFPLPEPLIEGPAPRIMSLRDGTKKMSKSDPSDFSRINLMDDVDTIDLKIRKAKTDPYPLPDHSDGLIDRPEAKNLVTLYGALLRKEGAEVLKEFGGKDFAFFKKALTDVLVSVLGPLRQEILKILEDVTVLEQWLGQGRQEALEKSQETLKEVRSLVGFYDR